jgi:integrase
VKYANLHITPIDHRLVILHTMRHTAITELADSGASQGQLKRFSGHKSDKMVWRYIHATEERVDYALDQLEKGRTKVIQIATKKKTLF